jgi:glycosyltransferase involved in cell wall biosynthesis/GT2 family glycosyltransferase
MSLTRPIDAVIVFPSQTLGGAENWLLDLLASTRQPACWEAVLLADGPLRGKLNDLGIPVTVFPTGPRGIDVARTIRQLTRWLRSREPDVVVANGVKAGAVAVPAGLIASVRTVWIRHDFSWDPTLGRALARLADHVVGTSQALLDAIDVDGTVILPPLPAPPRARGEALQFWEERGYDLSRPTLATMSRLIAYKGVDDAIRALASPEGQPWQLVVVGPDDPTAPGEATRLQALAVELGVAERVFFAGEVPHASQWLAAFDAVAVLTKPHPVSRYVAEGFSMVVLESVIAGTPVIASDTTPAAKLVSEAALLVRPNSPEQVADALSRIRALRPQALSAAERLKLTHPTTEDSAAELLRVVRETARRPGAGCLDGPPMTVVVTVLNEVGAIDELITALLPQLGVEDEVVVVDGGSSDGTVEALQRWGALDSRFRHLVVHGAGISAGRNIAINAANNEIMATTDAGCVPDPGWLAGLRAAMGGRSAPSLATGVYTVSARSSFERAAALACYPDGHECNHPSLVVRIFAPLGRVFAADEPTGRSMAFDRAAWTAAGGFNERLSTAEDVAFGAAVVAAGGRAVLTTDATVAWEQRPTIGSTVRMYRRYGRDGGRSRRLKPIARDLSRAGAYALAVGAVCFGGRRARTLLVAGSVAYLAQPVIRGLRERADPTALLLIPAALAVKDLSKAVGCIDGILATQAHGSG